MPLRREPNGIAKATKPIAQALLPAKGVPLVPADRHARLGCEHQRRGGQADAHADQHSRQPRFGTVHMMLLAGNMPWSPFAPRKGFLSRSERLWATRASAAASPNCNLLLNRARFFGVPTTQVS